MGRWFAQFFRDRGFKVTITGRTFEKAERVANELNVSAARSNSEAASEADLVLVATPINITAETIRAVQKDMKKGAAILDIASSKGGIIEALEEVAKSGIRASSLHPMFGPGAESLRGQRILLIPVRDNLELAQQLAEFFQAEGAVVYRIPNGEVHDRMMALTLALPYFLNAVFALAIPPEALSEVKKFAGTTFTLQLLVAESVLHDLDLSVQLQTENRAFPELLKGALRDVERLREVVLKGDKAAVEEILKEAKSRLTPDPDFSKAYEKFYAALRAIA